MIMRYEVTIDKPALSGPGGETLGKMLQLIYGRFAGQTVCLAAKLGIADRIGAGLASTKDLAAALDANPSSLRRFLRALASYGILAEDGPDLWDLTPAGELLRGDVTGSVRDLARFFAAPEHAHSWLALEHSVLTGGCAFQHVHGVDAWTYAQEHPDFNESFNKAMSSIAGSVHQAIAGVYDFAGIELLVDLGGGHGHLMGHILERFPEMRGIVYDMPHVVNGAESHIAGLGLADRCQAVAGDFFTSVPGGADAYIMTAILHDWDDEASATILRNCRRAMKPGARVLIGDFVLKSSNEPDLGKAVDLEMLVITPSGRERTENDFRQLLQSCGLRLNRILPLPSGNSLVEAVIV
jgi:hypothetical protein